MRRTINTKTRKVNRRLLAIICMAGMLLSLLTGCGKDTDSVVDEAENLPEIIVGSDNYPPYNYEDANGDPTGIDVDLATEAFRRMGYQAVFVTINWEEKKQLVESGKIDCIWGSFSINGREDQYQWTEPYMYSRQVIAVCEQRYLYACRSGRKKGSRTVYDETGGNFSVAF